MSKTKTLREKKRQLGQFLTPRPVAAALVTELELDRSMSVLEPSMGDGSFVLPLIERFMTLREGPVAMRLAEVLNENVFAVEVDPVLYDRCLEAIRSRWGELPDRHNLVLADFFRHTFRTGSLRVDPINGCFTDSRSFDLIIGNPPFGGTIDPEIQDELDAEYGFRGGQKIKKETYSFFIVRCLDALRHGGRLRFICSDTFLTIPTMRGLRDFVLSEGEPSIRTLTGCFDETAHPMVVLDVAKTGPATSVRVDEKLLETRTIHLSGNRSWGMHSGFAELFRGPKLGDIMVASSGMTIGKNALFVREIRGHRITEHLRFEFVDEPITLARELERARLGYLPTDRIARITEQERRGEARRNVRCSPLESPVHVDLPSPDYCYYNKAVSGIVYSPPTHVVFWKNEGDAVLTFKKSGNWYLHGVGGQPFFKREGLTWQLIAQDLNTRYLPPGYILDSGAPCAFLRPGVPRDELYFVLAWTLSPLCTQILKQVLNHTKNIQSKDFERLPYPHWVLPDAKTRAIERYKSLLLAAQQGRVVSRRDRDITELCRLFELDQSAQSGAVLTSAKELAVA